VVLEVLVGLAPRGLDVLLDLVEALAGLVGIE
jgi:hypothetical protein